MSTKRAKKKKQQAKRHLCPIYPKFFARIQRTPSIFLDVDMLNINRSITPRMAEPVAALNKILDKYV